MIKLQEYHYPKKQQLTEPWGKPENLWGILLNLHTVYSKCVQLVKIQRVIGDLEMLAYIFDKKFSFSSFI